MNKKEARRKFNLKDGRVVEFGWHYGLHQHYCNIYVPYTPQETDVVDDEGNIYVLEKELDWSTLDRNMHLRKEEFTGLSKHSKRQALREAILEMKLALDADFKKVYNRLQPQRKYPSEDISKMRGTYQTDGKLITEGFSESEQKWVLLE